MDLASATTMRAAMAPESVQRERTRNVLLALGALVLIVASVVWMATPRARSLDAAATFAEMFEARELPHGFALAQAEELARGDLLLRFERSGLEPEPARVEAPASTLPDDERSDEDREPTFDWSRVDYGVPGAPPREIVLVRLPLRHARADLDALFQGGREFDGDWRELGDGGGKRVLRRGTLAWQGLDCPWVHERQFERGGTFRDVVRVNLSRERQPMTLLARFGRGVFGDPAPVNDFLGALALR